MSTSTTNLGLFKYDIQTDGDSPFSITDALNNNWDKIDEFVSTVNTVFDKTDISQTGKNVFDSIFTELNKKLEAEVSLGIGSFKFTKYVPNLYRRCYGGTVTAIAGGSFTKYVTLYAPDSFVGDGGDICYNEDGVPIKIHSLTDNYLRYKTLQRMTSDATITLTMSAPRLKDLDGPQEKPMYIYGGRIYNSMFSNTITKSKTLPFTINYPSSFAYDGDAIGLISVQSDIRVYPIISSVGKTYISGDIINPTASTATISGIFYMAIGQ